jgi:ATP-dependent RNA helicase SUPV3L1/SUV3
LIESRSEQARLFNDPNSKLSVLVASDAIGMGLNLNIKRIIFTKFKKFNGKEEALISLSQGKQIAGRAGRFGTQWENGLVTSLHSHSIPILKSYLNETPEELNSAGISPQIEQLEKFARVLPNLSFSRLLQQFEQLATVDGDFFLCNIQQQIEAAQLIENVQLSLRDKYVFIQAPCNTRDDTLTSYLHEFATSHSMGHTINADRLLNIFPLFNEEKLAHLEVFHRAIMLYLWLSNRFPETFHEAEKVHQFKNKIEGAINQKLMRGNLKTRNQNQDSHHILEPMGTFKHPNPSTRKREDEY